MRNNSLDTYDDMPDRIKRYISNYGFHLIATIIGNGIPID